MMTPSQVADKLTIREFLQLVAVVEACFGRKEKVYSALHGTNGECAVAERSQRVKFDVVGIVVSLGGHHKAVTVSAAGQPDTTFYWDNLRAWPNNGAVAA